MTSGGESAGRRLAVVFEAPRRVAVVEEPTPGPAAGEVLVRTSISAISAGTELLIYRGEVPPDLAADETLPALAGGLRFPLRYGYSVAGEVVETGRGVGDEWLGRRVFAFQPHHSRFVCPPSELHAIPPQIGDEEAVFLPNVETAVNLLLDGEPRIGERVVVFGQGVVGLLATALLSALPLDRLITVDPLARRRELSLELGADESLDPAAPDFAEGLADLLAGEGAPGADLVFELSGSPAALDQALAAAGFAARVVIGSWYGRKRVSLDLGGRFHRSRIEILSSQVSSLAPQLGARWSKARRLEVSWRRLGELGAARLADRLVDHRLPLSAAARAYEMLDREPEKALQVIFEHP